MRKEIQKKWKRGPALLGQPRLPFGPASGTACLPLPSLPRTDARLVPASDGHVAAVRRRWARRGRPASPGRDADSSPQAAPLALSPAPLSLLPPLAQRSSSSSAARHCQRKLRRSPPTAPELQAHRREHQRTRRRHGKPLRALYRGEKQLCAVNRSPELLRARRSALPRRILLFPTSFRSFFGALGQS